MRPARSTTSVVGPASSRGRRRRRRPRRSGRPARPPPRPSCEPRRPCTPRRSRRSGPPPRSRSRCPPRSAGPRKHNRARSDGSGRSRAPSRQRDEVEQVVVPDSRACRRASAGRAGAPALPRTRCRGSRSPSRPASPAAPRRSPCGDGGSRLFVGSSSRSRFLRPATSWASASFVFSPPDSVPASWNAISPVQAEHAEQRAQRLVVRARLGPHVVETGPRRRGCPRAPGRSSRARPRGRTGTCRRRPAVCPVRMRSRLVLPAPFRPMISSRSPAPTSNDTSSNTGGPP